MDKKMPWSIKASFTCYTIALLLSFTFSLIYLSRSEFMPYHSVAVEKDWSEVSPAFQILLIALMKAAGGGWLSTSIAATIILLKPFRQGLVWAYWALPAICLPAMFVNLYVTIWVTMKTAAAPPWGLSLAGVFVLMAGFVLSLISKKISSTHQIQA